MTGAGHRVDYDESLDVAEASPMQLNATGFVSPEAGSVASANAMLLREMIGRRIFIKFFSKPSFVDPRKVVADLPENALLRLNDCTNHVFDFTRRCLAPSGRGLWGRLWSTLDAYTYNRGLVRSMVRCREGDADVWLGDWARGRGNRPVISYAQGPPGTDARSVIRHRELIEKLAGRSYASKLLLYAKYRLSVGLPDFQLNDRIIVGSEWSRDCLKQHFDVESSKTFALPYPIDLQLFKPGSTLRSTRGPVKLLWLGRFAPRKRLDLFLDGLAEAIRNGCDAVATVVGRSDFVPNFERLIAEFPYPERIEHKAFVNRSEVPELLWMHDVMCQPSDEENFGSSVAEAMACGIPSIVGATNGTGDYLCHNSIRLEDECPSTFANAIEHIAQAKQNGQLLDCGPTCELAAKYFDPTTVVNRFLTVVQDVLVATK